MKKVISIFALLLCSVLSFAFEVDGIAYYVTSKESLTVEVGSNNYSGDIVIPEKVEYEGNEYTVTSIGGYAFWGCSSLTSVTIPNSVTSIGESAFRYCNSLTSVTIGNSVTSIGGGAFNGCSSLTSVIIPNSVTNIGSSAFEGCWGLTEVIIPNSVTSIGKQVFVGCSGLTSVTIPNSVTSIGREAFADCRSLTYIDIPNSVTNIGSYAFSGCSGLTSVTIPNSVTSIGNYAFRGCSSLTSIDVESGNSNYDSRDNCNAIIEKKTNTLISGCQNTVIPNSVTSIGYRAFESCSGLTSVTIPNSVTSIEGSAFEGCWGLTEVIIPNSVTSIGGSAFFGCIGLTSVTIPNSVTSIGESAFSSCSGLTSVKVERGNSKYDSRDNCNAIIETNTNILIAGCQNTTIPNSVTSIGDGAFWNCSGLTSVAIPNSVASIGDDAFEYCSGLTSVTIGNSVTSIGGYAFRGCSGLTSVTIPNSVTSIGESAFHYCNSLTSVTIGNSVTSIGSDAFFFCWGLTEVISLIEEPFDIETSVWESVNTNEIPLYVPAGTKEKYEAAEGWNVFTNIIEMGIAPSEGEDINYGGGEISGETNLNGNVVGNIYYNIGDENGEYSSAEGCITLRTPVSDEQMSQVEGMDLFGEDMKNNFTGIIFMVQAGSGTIKVNAETTGNMTLKVKVGSSKPMEFTLSGKMDAKLPYEVSEPTYVYIYGGSSSAAGVKGVRKAAGDGEVKIYGISWTSGTDGIETIDNGQLTIDNSPVYNLNGQRVQSLQKGINIVNGKKVLVK